MHTWAIDAINCMCLLMGVFEIYYYYDCVCFLLFLWCRLVILQLLVRHGKWREPDYLS